MQSKEESLLPFFGGYFGASKLGGNVLTGRPREGEGQAVPASVGGRADRRGRHILGGARPLSSAYHNDALSVPRNDV